MILGGAPVTPALVNLSNSKLPNSKFLIGYGMTGKTPSVRAFGPKVLTVSSVIIFELPVFL